MAITVDEDTLMSLIENGLSDHKLEDFVSDLASRNTDMESVERIVKAIDEKVGDWDFTKAMYRFFKKELESEGMLEEAEKEDDDEDEEDEDESEEEEEDDENEVDEEPKERTMGRWG